MYHVGDVVLFVPLLPLPVPRGKMRMYTVGVVLAHIESTVHTEGVVCISDTCNVEHMVYERFVKLLSCPRLTV